MVPSQTASPSERLPSNLQFSVGSQSTPLKAKHLTGLACCQSHSLTCVKVTATHIPTSQFLLSPGSTPL